MSCRTVLIALALAALVALVYAPVRDFAFVQLDDPAYVSENPHVLRGLTLDGAAWAFTTGHAANWHPVTWLSHMVDISLFGTDAGPHHVTSLLLHIASTLLLFGVLARMTGALWPSALVAALFGVHPLHVESVAWVAERKDVLSTLFWMLTLWAYLAYVRSSTPAPSAGAPEPESSAKKRAAAAVSTGTTRTRRKVFYALTLACFALGLMAKPMLVTLPFVLLLLDWWPLGRVAQARTGDKNTGRATRGLPSTLRHAQGHPEATRGATTLGPGKTPGAIAGLQPSQKRAGSLWPLVREKIPFFLMATASGAVTLVVQQQGGAVSAVGSEPFVLRVQNALVSSVAYLRDMLWPAGLTVIYPFPQSIPAWQVAGACLVLAGISFLAYRLARRHPWLPVGWLWYLVTLVPVAGLVRVGLQAKADRYTYVPLVGVFVMIAWGVAALAARVRVFRHALPAMAAIAVLGCAVAAREQVGHWKDNISLWTQATMVTLRVDEFEAHMSLGTSLGNQGRVDEARRHFAEAARLRPQSDAAHYGLGLALAKSGLLAEAAREFNEALRLNPGSEAARRAADGLARRDRD